MEKLNEHNEYIDFKICSINICYHNHLRMKYWVQNLKSIDSKKTQCLCKEGILYISIYKFSDKRQNIKDNFK